MRWYGLQYANASCNIAFFSFFLVFFFSQLAYRFSSPPEHLLKAILIIAIRV